VAEAADATVTKPELILAEPTLDGLLAMFERIVGRPATPAERRDVEQACAAMADDDKARR
jgi:hypothetical protein